MPQMRGGPVPDRPVTRREVAWSHSARAWHAVPATGERWGVALCQRSRAGGVHAFAATDYPEGPPLRDHRPVCEPCLEQVQAMPDRPEGAHRDAA